MQTYKPTSPAASSRPTTYRSHNIVVPKHDWDDAQRTIRNQKQKNITLCSEINDNHYEIIELKKEIDRLRKNRNDWMKHAQHLKQKLKQTSI